MPTYKYNLIGVKIGTISISNKEKAGTDDTNYYYSNIYFSSKLTNRIWIYGDTTFGNRSLHVENDGTFTNIDGTVKKEYNIGTSIVINKYNHLSVEYKKEFIKNNANKKSVKFEYRYMF